MRKSAWVLVAAMLTATWAVAGEQDAGEEEVVLQPGLDGGLMEEGWYVERNAYVLHDDGGTPLAEVETACEVMPRLDKQYWHCRHQVKARGVAKPFMLYEGRKLYAAGFNQALATYDDGCCDAPDVITYYSRAGKRLGEAWEYGEKGFEADEDVIVPHHFSREPGTLLLRTNPRDPKANVPERYEVLRAGKGPESFSREPLRFDSKNPGCRNGYPSFFRPALDGGFQLHVVGDHESCGMAEGPCALKAGKWSCTVEQPPPKKR